MTQLIRVLVVDDSAYVRKTIKQMLSRSPFIEIVGVARDGKEALEMVAQLKPDVVTLDLIMPNMNGVQFLREQMEKNPLPVIIVSIASENGEMTLEALDAGAVDFLQKPTALANEKIFQIADELIQKVKAAANIRLSNLPIGNQQEFIRNLPTKLQANTVDIVTIGISTGGPQALSFLIPQLPESFPVPIAVVLHMPVGYTQMYAQRLDAISALNVVEARENDPVIAGKVLIAPAGKHLSFIRRSNGNVVTHLDARPFDTLHRPSVDVLFQSAAEVYRDRVLGVVMTGMGSDGKQGSAWIKSLGGLIFTESEETCVVYGMPRAVIEASLSDRTVRLDKMASAIMEVL